MAWWPLSRSRREPAAAAGPTTGPGPTAEPPPPVAVSAPEPADPGGAWRDLPALQRTLSEPAGPVAIGDDFRHSLASFRDPSFLAPLAHQVDPSAGGLVEGLASVGQPSVHRSAADLPVPQRAAEPAPRVQRAVSWPGSYDLSTVRWELPAAPPADEPLAEPVPTPVTSGAQTRSEGDHESPPSGPHVPDAHAPAPISIQRSSAPPAPPALSSEAPVGAPAPVPPRTLPTLPDPVPAGPAAPGPAAQAPVPAASTDGQTDGPPIPQPSRSHPPWHRSSSHEPAAVQRMADPGSSAPLSGFAAAISHLTAAGSTEAAAPTAHGDPNSPDPLARADPPTRALPAAPDADHGPGGVEGPDLPVTPRVVAVQRTTAHSAGPGATPAHAPTLGERLARAPLLVQRVLLTGRVAAPAEPVVQRVEFLAPDPGVTSRPAAGRANVATTPSAQVAIATPPGPRADEVSMVGPPIPSVVRNHLSVEAGVQRAPATAEPARLTAASAAFGTTAMQAPEPTPAEDEVSSPTVPPAATATDAPLAELSDLHRPAVSTEAPTGSAPAVQRAPAVQWAPAGPIPTPTASATARATGPQAPAVSVQPLTSLPATAISLAGTARTGAAGAQEPLLAAPVPSPHQDHPTVSRSLAAHAGSAGLADLDDALQSPMRLDVGQPPFSTGAPPTVGLEPPTPAALPRPAVSARAPFGAGPTVAVGPAIPVQRNAAHLAEASANLVAGSVVPIAGGAAPGREAQARDFRSAEAALQTPLVVSRQQATGVPSGSEGVRATSFAGFSSALASGAGSLPAFGSGSTGDTSTAAEGGLTSVQLKSAGDPPGAEPSGTPLSVQSAPAPPPAGGGATSAADLDEMARRLYEPLSARLRAELWLDRERAGVMSDV